MAQKPSIPKGTRDFSPLEMSRRNYIFDAIREVFRLFGFMPIETPSMENLSTLMGKYGEEGDKLLFKILNSGDWLAKADKQLLADGQHIKATSQICEKGLRYDLTVPFARYVVQHRAEIQLPFKRYQIQPVWRADRPQKGRYREFFQCDADIVGSDSLVNEIQLLQLIDEVFARLGIRVAIKLNNRKILAGIADVIGAPDKMVDITVAIDKLDKIGMDAVNEELAERGLSQESILALGPILAISGTTDQRLEDLENALKGNDEGMKGIAELREIIDTTRQLGLRAELDLDVSLARGLNYYTGSIIEVKALDAQIGSISGGGRYDNLTGIFGLPGISGVGISFGADRIYDVMSTLNLWPDASDAATQVIFLNLGDAEALASMKAIAALRHSGISAEIYPDNAKMKKQMTYANSLSIPFVAIIGETELADGTVTVKNMTSGSQLTVPADRLAATITDFPQQ